MSAITVVFNSLWMATHKTDLNTTSTYFNTDFSDPELSSRDPEVGRDSPCVNPFSMDDPGIEVSEVG